MGSSLPETSLPKGKTPSPKLARAFAEEESDFPSLTDFLTLKLPRVCSQAEDDPGEAQKRRWLADLCRGEKLGAFCLTEPRAGSDARSLSMRAAPAPGGYTLRGTKTFVTNGIEASAYILEIGKVNMGAIGVGLAEAAYRPAVAHAGIRRQFGRKIADFQAVQFMVADMYAGIRAARLLVQEAADLFDTGQAAGYESAMAKCYATDTAMRVVTEAAQVLGGTAC